MADALAPPPAAVPAVVVIPPRQAHEREICDKWWHHEDFAAPNLNQIATVHNCLFSVAGVVIDALGNLHNWVMAQKVHAYVKIPAITVLAVMMIPAFILAIFDTAARIALFVISSPALLFEGTPRAISILIGASSVISLAQMVNAFWTAGNMYFSGTNITAWADGMEFSKHVTLENMLTFAIMFFCRAGRNT